MDIKNIKLTISKTVISMLAIVIFWWILVIVNPFSKLNMILGNFTQFVDKNRLFEVVFIILLLKIYDKNLKISLKRMFTKISFKVLTITLLCTAVYIFLGNIILNGKMCTFNFRDDSINWICSLLWLGLFEEIAFRGWGYTAFYSSCNDNSKIKLFNKFEVEKSALKASVMTNIFFALFHMQTYMMFYKYKTITEYIVSLFMVFIVGLYFTIVFHKTKSIWNVIILHAFWDWFMGVMVF